MIKDIINRKREQHKINRFLTNGKITSNDKKIAEGFNKLYVDIGKTLSDKVQVLQVVSVIGANHVIRVAILRALRYPLVYSHKTWIFRISRSSADAISVIRAGHYAVDVIPNIHNCANSVMNLAGALLRFPRAWRR